MFKVLKVLWPVTFNVPPTFRVLVVDTCVVPIVKFPGIFTLSSFNLNTSLEGVFRDCDVKTRS